MSGLDSLGSAYQDDDFEDEQDEAAMPEVSAAQVSPASQGQELDGSTGNADAALLMDGAPGIGASLLESCHVVQSLEGGLQNGNSSSAGHADVPHTADKDAHNADVLDSSIDTIRELGKTRAPLCAMRLSWAHCGSVCLRLLSMQQRRNTAERPRQLNLPDVRARPRQGHTSWMRGWKTSSASTTRLARPRLPCARKRYRATHTRTHTPAFLLILACSRFMLVSC